MGIILRQSFWNMLLTYAGFLLGALNTLVLYAQFFSTEGYGLVMSMVSISAIVMPFIAIGMNNALIRFIPSSDDKDALLSFSLLIPTVAIALLGAVAWWNIDSLTSFFPQGEIIKDFIWLVFVIAATSAYFEVFYGYAQSHMRSSEGVALREMFYRLSTAVLLVAVYMGLINEIEFCYYLTASYVIRALLMMWVAYDCRPFRLKCFKWDKYRNVISYGIFSSMGMAIWAALLEFDKSMLPFYESLTVEAYYTVAAFIGMTVAVPYRSLYQIANPILSRAIAEEDISRQHSLSRKSSLYSLIICGTLFLIINCNINDIYRLLPAGYEAGAMVVLIISAAKVVDSISGLSGSQIVYSKYYKWDLVFSVCLMVCVTGSNLYFIPRWGMNGAAIATLISLTFINTLRIGFVYIKTGIFPFRTHTLVVAVLLAIAYWVFTLPVWDINGDIWVAIATILVKSLTICITMASIIYFTGYVPELNEVVNRVIKKNRDKDLSK